ncbi:hypothetical protein D0Z07_2115 [Hyphodiscus hymeniophilus]|uniref:BTB domain-containing protein n=1 Tax=Hyphodiscus hymeniophilus TaxID=353542 RepID=A0A9P6VPS8_9HELO|nr:hypothetical protein D0Z07_2115 [Hyphodiscus hymeniophilus]
MTTVVFKSPGLVPDLRLTVFGKEFHVHSAVLRLHSAFFRKFLDSTEKPSSPAGTRNLFKYDYVSVVDDDDSWGLEPISMVRCTSRPQQTKSCSFQPLCKLPSATTEALKDLNRVKTEQNAFEKVLRAIYCLSYDIDSVCELEDVTRIADFYCALPALSSSLYRGLWKDTGLITSWDGIFTNADTVLAVAKKLRHPILFREAVIIIVSQPGRWLCGREDFLSEDDDNLKAVVLRAHHRLCRLKLKADHHVREALRFLPITSKSVRLSWHPEDEFSGHDHYTQIMNKLKATTFNGNEKRVADAIRSLEALLKNNLVLTKPWNGINGGCGSSFYCTEVDDKDLPWDETETDW